MHPHGEASSRFYSCFLCSVSKVWPLLPGHAACPLSRAASRPAGLFLPKASVCLRGCAENGLSWAQTLTALACVSGPLLGFLTLGSILLFCFL